PVVCARARLALAHGDADDAVEICRIGLRQASGERDPSLMVPAVLVEQARACGAVGDHDGRRRAVAEAQAQLADAADPGSLRTALAALSDGPRARSAEPDELSDRELDVLRALAGSGSLRDVADGLRISHNTVKTHARTLYAKLGVGSRQEAVGRGRELGLLGDARRRSPERGTA
ncbi:MAG: LuxR C-terminal-related transcriptional regulator, partial [Patulibacter sp.]